MDGLRTIGTVKYASETFKCRGKMVKPGRCKKGKKCPKRPHVYCAIGKTAAKKKLSAAEEARLMAQYSGFAAAPAKKRLSKGCTAALCAKREAIQKCCAALPKRLAKLTEAEMAARYDGLSGTRRRGRRSAR